MGARGPTGNVRKVLSPGTRLYAHTHKRWRSVAGCHCPELMPESVVCAGEGLLGHSQPLEALCFLGVSINSTPLGSRTKLSSPFKAALSLTSKRVEESLPHCTAREKRSPSHQGQVLFSAFSKYGQFPHTPISPL